MQTATTSDPGRSFAERILGELQEIKAELLLVTRDVGVLHECATLLLRPMHEKDQDSPLQAMMRLMHLLVAGTEETHKKLEAMNSALFDQRMNAALRAAILDS